MSFFDLSPKAMTILATVIGYALIDELSAAEQNSLGNFLMLIGQVLETSAAQQQVFNAKTSDQKMKDLEDKLEHLMQKMTKV